MCMGMHVDFKAGPPIFVFMKLALVKDIRLLKEGKSYIAPTLDVCVAHVWIHSAILSP